MVFSKIQKVLMDQLDLKQEDITMDSAIVDDLGADSLDIVDLVMTLEEVFDTEIPDEVIENLVTVGDVVRYVEKHQAE
jgi:acyl carrier protein